MKHTITITLQYDVAIGKVNPVCQKSNEIYGLKSVFFYKIYHKVS